MDYYSKFLARLLAAATLTIRELILLKSSYISSLYSMCKTYHLNHLNVEYFSKYKVDLFRFRVLEVADENEKV